MQECRACLDCEAHQLGALASQDIEHCECPARKCLGATVAAEPVTAGALPRARGRQRRAKRCYWCARAAVERDPNLIQTRQSS